MAFWRKNNIVSKNLDYYDLFVNKINCKYVWKCNEKNIYNLYTNNIQKHHIEIGPGTGYYLKPFISNLKSLELVDINSNILRYANMRLLNPNLKKKITNINLFQKNNILKIDNEITSIGVNCVLHCVPGPIEVSIDNLIHNLKKENKENKIIIFGSSVINDSEKNILQDFELGLLNYFRIFDNKQDNEERLITYFQTRQLQYKIHKVGSIILFSIYL